HHTTSSCPAPPPTQTTTLSLHDALPISADAARPRQERQRERGRHAVAGPRVGQARIALALRARVVHVHHAPGSHGIRGGASQGRSEEHTSELQSLAYLVCRLLLEKKKTT